MAVRQLADELGGNKSRGVTGKYPDLRGTSYGGVRQYAEGKVANPRAELLRAMADVLGVRQDWLAFNQGPMTEAEAARERDAQAVVSRASPNDLSATGDQIERGLAAGLPFLRDGAGPTTWSALAQLHGRYSLRVAAKRLAAVRLDSVGIDEDELRKRHQELEVDLAKETGIMVGLAARAAGVDLKQVSHWQREAYIESVCHALQLLFVEPHEIAGAPGSSPGSH